MITFLSITNCAYYVTSFLLCTILAGYGMPKRKLFWLRIALCTAALFGAYMLSGSLMMRLGLRGFSPVSLTRYVFFFIIAAATVGICFECNFWAAIFCATVGYCLEHLAERLFEVVNRPFLQGASLPVVYLIRTVIFAVAVSSMFFLFIRKSKYYKCNIMVDNKQQTMISVIVVGVLIFINSMAISASMGNMKAILYINIMNIAFSFVTIVFELGIASNKKNEEEILTIKRVLYEERKRYLLDKEYVEMINIKCHDLRHQLEAGEGELDKEAASEIRDTIKLYDDNLDTGNDALNVVLQKKLIECNRSGIQLTCLIDGRKLEFLSAYEIYSLFGNALDNAIGAAKEMEEKKRIISITDSGKENFINIHIENYCAGGMQFVDGLPQTQKNRNYHGFGMKSMRYIAEKYNGVLRAYVRDEIFILEILFPDINAAGGAEGR